MAIDFQMHFLYTIMKHYAFRNTTVLWCQRNTFGGRLFWCVGGLSWHCTHYPHVTGICKRA